MAEQKFALFVSAAKGHLVSRPDGGGREYFGATVTPAEQRTSGAEPVVWDEERVFPILPAVAERHSREFSRWFRTGALSKRTEEDWKKWVVADAKREEERDIELKKAADEAKKAADAAKTQTPDAQAAATEESSEQ
jgi:hypothetical protein